ncbi:formylglycine-generating enzyme family protein [Rhodoferax antarcticus]|uniref:formylglycine-generating enzyme family protein n=1 Tax=Rhodoferax antarcticus TaxID=81479 RepID=UPI0009500E12|nr:SUMF1/EgtB/PvdO family nonheme iron enzyme [Rhodoferax antarcticus]APW45674.1 protein NirV [Rhodoferax antarcticus]
MNTIDMVYIAPAIFCRGSSIYTNEGPIKKIALSGFWIDRFPVTNERYTKFILADGYSRREFWTDQGWDFVTSLDEQKPLYWNDFNWNQPKQPVTGVSWWEAIAFSKFEGKSLPTEAQWEYAACGGIDLYPWGNERPTESLANFAPGCEPAELNRRSTSVDAHPLAVSRNGCHDMAGNLNEWCLDNISPDYRWDEFKIDPIYATAENLPHVVRGGSGLHDEDCLRCASRDYYSPELRDNIVGIRCVLNEQFIYE